MPTPLTHQEPSTYLLALVDVRAAYEPKPDVEICISQ